MALLEAGADAAFLLGRALFALVVGYLALGNLLDLETAVGYAQSKGVPLASVAVPLGSLGLVAGSLGVLLGVYPAVGVLVSVGVLGPVTVVMHDFWTMEGQTRRNEQVHFLENVGLIGATLVTPIDVPLVSPLLPEIRAVFGVPESRAGRSSRCTRCREHPLGTHDDTRRRAVTRRRTPAPRAVWRPARRVIRPDRA